MKRYRPQFKPTGGKRWQSFPNAYNFGQRRFAEAFIKKTRKVFKAGGRTGRFRIKVDTYGDFHTI